MSQVILGGRYWRYDPEEDDWHRETGFLGTAIGAGENGELQIVVFVDSENPHAIEVPEVFNGWPVKRVLGEAPGVR